MIYLDNAATTFPKPEVVYDKMNEVNRKYCVNAGRGSYSLARRATQIIDETKQNIAKLINIQDASKVILTPSVTIAINQVLAGIEWKSNDVLYVSPYEHNAVARTARLLEKKYKIRVLSLPINEETLELDLEKMKYEFIQNHPTCVCINHISNVTGYIQPIEEVLLEAKKYNAITVLDTAQSLGLVEIDLNRLPVDFTVFTGHKCLYGPFGVGGLIYNSKMVLQELLVGGTGSDSLNLNMPEGLPYRYESSSPNIVAIAGLNEAIKWRETAADIYQHEKKLTEYLISKLKELEGIKFYLPNNLDNHIGIVSINIKGYSASDIGMILDEDFNIAVRTGYHCAPYIHQWLKDEKYHGTVRISLGYFNSEKDIDKLFCALKELIEEI